MRAVNVAVIQMACSDNRADNVAQAEHWLRAAKREGADIALLPELFEGRYFPQSQTAAAFAQAAPRDAHPTLQRMRRLAAELNLILPVSYFERANQAHFNSIIVFDGKGHERGHYRKSHIPDGPGYQEKFYFTPGDSGFKAIDCGICKIGVGICWDQWFPEAARAMALKGAEILLYPTAIGSEPQDPHLNSRAHWRRAMQGHAAANLMPVAAANRVGREALDGASAVADATLGGRAAHLDFYGCSFIADETGDIVAGLAQEDGAVLVHEFDLDAIAAARASWGLFRDRRCDLYGDLLTHDGGVK